MTISRISNLATNTQLINFLLRAQKRMMDTEVQISSEKVSQNYAGVSLDAERLINIENNALILGRYKRNNELVDVKMQTMEATIEGIKETVSDFREAVFEFSGGSTNVEVRVEVVQKAAFRALKDMEAHLNTDFNGDYMFSGARTGTQPADFGLTNLATFQSKWTGDASTGTLFPVTRDHDLFPKLTATTGTPWDGVTVDTTARSHGTLSFAAGTSITATTAGALANIPVGGTITIAGTASNNGVFTVSTNNGTMITTAEATTLEASVGAATIAKTTHPTSGYGTLAFADANPDTITASRTGAFGNIPVGAKITVTGSASNNGTFTVDANTGTVITLVSSDTLAVEGATAAPTVTVDTSYYQGDNVVENHRVSKIQSFDFDINATDPAFEKAIRAMGIILQGVFGTAGGLDNNTVRIDDTLNLLDLSLNPPATTTQPYGTELASNIEEVELDHGFKRTLIDRNNQNHETLIGFFEAQVAAVENIDTLDAVTRLLDDSQALEASYQALARIRQLSLSNFL